MTAALDLLSALVIDDDQTRWGKVALDWQWQDARAVLDPALPTPYHFLTRGRAASKTADLAGMAVAAMLEQAPQGARLYALAADRDQGRLILDSIEAYQARTPLLHDALTVGSWRVTAGGTGATLDVLAADAPGAWGLRPWFVIVDELAQWPGTTSARRLWEAVTSAVAKIDDARMAVLTSAGDPAHWSHRELEHAKADPLWRVHEVAGPAPWLDPERVAEQQRRLPESSFRRLFLNEWTAAEDRLVDLDDLRACVAHTGALDPQPHHSYVIGLDVGYARDRTAVVVAHTEHDETALHVGPEGQLVVVDRLAVWKPTADRHVELAEVATWIGTASETYHGARLIYDPFQAVDLAQRLSRSGVPTEAFTFSSQSVGRLASALHSALRNRQLRLPDDEELLDELANVRLRETTPGVVRMDHDPDRHDDQAIALALCVQELLSRPAGVADSFDYRPTPGYLMTTSRGGLTLTGKHYFDQDPDSGELVPPPGHDATEAM